MGCNIDPLLDMMLPEGQSYAPWQLHHYAIRISADELGIYATTVVDA
jgi:hypothetical protein